MANKWQFWVDRGGTFTDIVARTPQDSVVSTKLLSSNPSQYADATIAGIQRLLQRYHDPKSHLAPQIEQVRIGTTVATNALLERTGTPTLFITTKGFADSLTIGYQHRERLFDLNIIKPAPLYQAVIEIDERISSDGEILVKPNYSLITAQLETSYRQGLRSCAIVLLHGYRYPSHELAIAKLATEIGFSQVSLSHQVSGLIKFVYRGDTTVADAYLSPILAAYVDSTSRALDGVPLQFMQSNGGLIAGQFFSGKDAILSGPAGGVVAMVETAKLAGYHQIIGFDMGGTSTDVSLYNNHYQRTWQSEVAGVRLRTPMMKIHTVAAGGGSILAFDGQRLRVGPASSGANPGPCCYGNDGPLSVTDLNVVLGKIQADFFPAIFGDDGKQPLVTDATFQQFSMLTNAVNSQTNQQLTSPQLAQGYLNIAIEHMSNAIKEISVAKGHDISHYLLSCFGGAGGQHACLVAQRLGITRILIHPLSGLLSAYGMGLASVRSLKQQSLDLELTEQSYHRVQIELAQLSKQVSQDLIKQSISPKQLKVTQQLIIRYQGSDSIISIDVAAIPDIRAKFEQAHLQRFGFIIDDHPLIVASIECEAVSQQDNASDTFYDNSTQKSSQPFAKRAVYFEQGYLDTPFYRREQLAVDFEITGPAIIIEAATTVVIEPDWSGVITEQGDLILSYQQQQSSANTSKQTTSSKDPDPILIEIFNNLYMHIAREMGLALQESAMSVNIKERLDFSCAIFNRVGDLVANAPHMPVHLGSMGESVKSIIKQNPQLKAGDSYLINSPYHGGTHLPDLTVITPVFAPDNQQQLLFFVASRGHHADIGGIAPASMPANSTNINQEGVLFDNMLLVEQQQFQTDKLIAKLSEGNYPSRNIAQNVADLKAQLAANNKGIHELYKMVSQYGIATVLAYMEHVQVSAEQCVRRAISVLKDGEFSYSLDHGAVVKVRIKVDQKLGQATVDFTGTSLVQSNNFNAPLAVTKAAVLYVFRTLVNDDIPLNSGCFRPITLIVPKNSMLNPDFPAAVVAGNVETSQVITDALYGALGIVAGSQGTMNNLTLGNQQYQYYETICGGSGAGADFNGCDAVQTHMTNSRLTDPEILESRFPLRLTRFAIRKNSGGEGRHRGGNGVIREIEVTQAMTASILSNRRVIAPFGVQGGQSGQLGKNTVIRRNGEAQELGSCASVDLEAGDTIRIVTPGGGGYGK